MTKALTLVEIDVPRFTTRSILHFDVDSQLDDSGNPSRVWTAAGNAAISTAQSKFGGASLSCDGTGDWIMTPADPSIDLGSNDFTIEFWIRFANSGVNIFPMGQVDAAGGGNLNTAWFFFRQGSDNKLYFFADQGTLEQVFASGDNTYLADVWNHVAVSRIGNTFKLFENGVASTGTGIHSGAINISTAKFGIGSLGDFTAQSLNGFVDEFRLDIGKARRISNFSVPAAAFTGLETIRFAVDAAYLPVDLADALAAPTPIIPSLKNVTIDPAIISLGEDIGKRATVTATFRDHKHVFGATDFDSGTFWGKFRARYGLKLRGYPLRVINGSLGQELTDMETRNFVIESTDGPSASGEFKIIAKDILKFADGDRSQAPVPSNGFLVANITNVATTCTLSPAGIGDAEYPTSGLVAIGGTEICSFTRGVPTSGDVLTLTRAQKNTAASEHSAQDRVQLVLQYTAQDVAVIINDLLVTYAGVPQANITVSNWSLETGAYLNTVYTATIAEPTSVAKLVSELIEQAGLAVWWDDIEEQVKLQVLRPVPTDSDVFSGDNYLAGSLAITEQPEKRLTQVYTYFAKLNPLVQEDQLNNYRSTSYVVDASAESDYGTAVIKKIFSRWIPDGGRAVADTLGAVQLARFRDPPRRINIDVLRGSIAPPDPLLGVGYQIEGWPFQEVDGTASMVPGQITSLNPRADIFKIEFEEISDIAFVTGGASPNEHDIIIDSNINNVNLRTIHDSVYGVPTSGVAVVCTVNSGIVVGSTSTSNPAFEVGTWPAGVLVTLIILGRIEGKGGNGGAGQASSGSSVNFGFVGGTALRTRKAITVSSNTGQIWGGGGGGGGGGVLTALSSSSGGGGGGAGKNAGAGGAAAGSGGAGSAGSATAGGAGGAGFAGQGTAGGAGGGPGLSGANGPGGAFGVSSGGAAGKSIDGISFVTFSGSSPQGDIRGPQAN